MREIRKSGSAGARGRQRPWATQSPSHRCEARLTSLAASRGSARMARRTAFTTASSGPARAAVGEPEARDECPERRRRGTGGPPCPAQPALEVTNPAPPGARQVSTTSPTSLPVNSTPRASAHLWPRRREHDAPRSGCRSPASPHYTAPRRLRPPPPPGSICRRAESTRVVRNPWPDKDGDGSAGASPSTTPRGESSEGRCLCPKGPDRDHRRLKKRRARTGS
jgi:hypothetical protein